MNRLHEVDPATGYALWAATYPAHAHNPFMMAEERAMLRLLPATLDGVHVLDVGCGSGRYLLHARARGATVTGVDPSPQMLEQARRYDLTVVQGSVTRLPVTEGCADLLICALTLGHVADLGAALKELARATRKNGTVLCSDFHPVADALGWKRTFSIEAQRYAVRFFTHHYAHWHAAAKAAGLRIDGIVEPLLDPRDVPAGRHFDPRALEVPVAIIFRMSRMEDAADA